MADNDDNILKKKIVQLNKKQILRIINATEKDSKVYNCTAKNSHGEIKRSLNLTVTVIPDEEDYTEIYISSIAVASFIILVLLIAVHYFRKMKRLKVSESLFKVKYYSTKNHR